MNNQQQAKVILEGNLLDDLVEEQKQALFAAWVNISNDMYGEINDMHSVAKALDGILWQVKERCKVIANG